MATEGESRSCYGAEITGQSSQTEEPQPFASTLASDEAYEIVHFFRQCETKQALLEGLLKHAMPCFQTVAVFSVHQGSLRWLAGRGPNLEVPLEDGFVLPLERLSLFRRCVSSKSPYRGPVPIDEPERGLHMGFILELPDECWIYPAAVGDMIDCIIYAERPLLPHPVCTERLEFITQKAILAMRRLVIELMLLRVDPA